MTTDLDRLEALLAAATPGPWQLDSAYPGSVYCDDATGSIVARVSGQGFEYAPRPLTEREANAALIVAAVNALPALLAEARQLREDAGRYAWLREAGVRVNSWQVDHKFIYQEDALDAAIDAAIADTARRVAGEGDK